jgi:hypothetical protein
MLDLIPYEWAVDQHVPLVYFILALLTRPSTWTKTGLKLIRKRFGGIEGGKDNSQQ